MLKDKIMTNKIHRVLLIDDDPMIRSWLMEVFADTEFELLEAANGKDGMSQLTRGPIDLVITDIIMPEKEGIELIIEVRQKYSNIPIIA
ncbi:MAG: response regulator, partial [Gammaproteobacteria bacterium]